MELSKVNQTLQGVGTGMVTFQSLSVLRGDMSMVADSKPRVLALADQRKRAVKETSRMPVENYDSADCSIYQGFDFGSSAEYKPTPDAERAIWRRVTV